MLEGDTSCRGKKSHYCFPSTSCHTSRMDLLFPRPEVSCVTGVGQQGSSASHVRYIPTSFPCLKHEKGHGARSGGSRCLWAGYNVVRTRTQCLQEQSCQVPPPGQGKGQVSTSEGRLKHVPGQSYRLPCWEAALYG